MPIDTITLTCTVVANPDQLSCELGAETVVLNAPQGTYFGLNEVAAAIWSKLQTSRTVAQIRDEIVQEFDVTPEQCERDLLALLQELADAGLVQIRPA